MKTSKFVRVRDASRRHIRGLYLRGRIYYARLKWGGMQWHRLKAVSVDQAKHEKATLESLRSQGQPPPNHREPQGTRTFQEFVPEYLGVIAGTKKARTVDGERCHLTGVLSAFFGRIPLRSITSRDVEEFRAKRLKLGRANRTVNHNMVVLRNLFKKARTYSLMESDPTAGIKALKLVQKVKRFLPIESIRAAAEWIRANVRQGDPIADAILFLAFSGARFTDGMAVRWEDVDFKRKTVCIGAEGDTKNLGHRYVDFHTDLKNHLLAVRARTQRTSGLLFPSYRSPDDSNPKPLKDISEAVAMARRALAQPHWTPHDLRHHFASRCVMAGIDFKTIAQWLGHRDGGMLVATVYGHLADGHGKLQATKLLSTAPTQGKGKILPMVVATPSAPSVAVMEPALDQSIQVQNPHPRPASNAANG